MDFETREVQNGKYRVSVLKDDQYIGPCIERGFEWDGWMRQDLPHLIRPNQDILDIGGNIGWNALMYSDYAPVHTFEPFYYKVIQKNIDQNQTKHPITLHPYGLSSVEKKSDFYIPKREGNLCNYGGSGLEVSPGHVKTEDQINLKVLDSAYMGAPCLIKVDVEGHEFEVLKGAAQTIRKYLPHMYIEIFDFETGPTVGFMNSLGYTTVYPRPEHNYLFISPLR